MKKLFKIVAVLIALGILLLIIGSIALRIYLPPEKAKALVLSHLSAQLKREVTLGSVSVGVFSGLQMTDLKISESPNFAKGTFLSSQQFSLKIALLPLLFRKIIVRQIVLDQPEVVLVRSADGKKFNFSDLTSETAPSAASSPAASEDKSLPFLLLITKAEVQKGALHFIDHSPAKQSMDVAPFDLTLKNVSLTSPFNAQLSFHVKSKEDDVAVSFGGEADLLKGSFLIKQANLTSRETKVSLTGDVSRLKSEDPAVDVKVDIAQLNFSDISAFVKLPSTLKITKPLKGKVTLVGDQKTAELQSQLTLGSVHLDGRGRLQNLASNQPFMAFHVETNFFPIAEVLAYAPTMVPAGVSLTGDTQVTADVSGTSAALQFAVKWIGNDLRVAQGDAFVKPAGIPLDLTMMGDVTTMEPLKVVVKSMTVHLVNNLLTGAGTYEVRGKQAFVNFAAKAIRWSIPELVTVSPLLAPYHPTGNLSFEAHATGPADAPETTLQTSGDLAMASVKHEYYEGQNLQMNWALTDVTPDLARVNGTSSLKQGPGKILNVEKLAASSRLGKIALAPIEVLTKLQKKGVLANVNLPSLQSIPFDSIVGDYVLRSGVVDVRSFDLNGKDLSVQNKGTVGLAGVQPINMNVLMKLAVGSVGGTLGAIMNDENGRPTVKFTATGSVANPQVKFDTRDVSKKAVQQAGEELMKNKDVQNAVGDLQKSLKGIFH